jgi:hypothetical protein
MKICIQTCVSNFEPPFNLKFMTLDVRCIANNVEHYSTMITYSERSERKRREEGPRVECSQNL